MLVKLEKRRPEREEERKVSVFWNKSQLIRNKNLNKEIYLRKSRECDTIKTKQIKMIWNLSQWHEFQIRLTKFDSTTGKLVWKKTTLDSQ